MRGPEAVCGVLGCALACMIGAMHGQCCLVGEGVLFWLLVDEGVLGSSVLSDVRKLVPCTSIAHAQTARSCGVRQVQDAERRECGCATSCCCGHQQVTQKSCVCRRPGATKLKVCIVGCQQ